MKRTLEEAINEYEPPIAGWEHDGLVQQPNNYNTVEFHIMMALKKTRLIESWEECDYSRCGRTDKGVSAFKQTAALIVRSADMLGDHVFWDSNSEEDIILNYKGTDELNYVKNVEWSSCQSRFGFLHGLQYAFPRADLDVEKMREACLKLIGEHDFSNFCQIDMNEKRVEQSYVRTVLDVAIDEFSKKEEDETKNPTEMLQLTVVGTGFLWHMIRFIVTVLVEVGRGKEEPTVVDDLLDISKTPSRPQYTTASEDPLCLFDCEYGESLDWRMDKTVLDSTISHLQKVWATYNSRSKMVEDMVSSLADRSESPDMNKGLIEFVLDHPVSQNHVKFADRPKCDSLKKKREKLELKKGAKIEETMVEEVKKEVESEAEEDGEGEGKESEKEEEEEQKQEEIQEDDEDEDEEEEEMEKEGEEDKKIEAE
ncbi:unnamed protein product [Caenorhabditis auriculariae]|uniref:tRNA pseudouridine synthase n=1 Tax=Caenorhabditis auriculariae TaxID=2777116 RepID=A0A8S1H9U7_9PELO|nr:unnamed protein product [Caenorhabditis auriculariae]